MKNKIAHDLCFAVFMGFSLLVAPCSLSPLPCSLIAQNSDGGRGEKGRVTSEKQAACFSLLAVHCSLSSLPCSLIAQNSDGVMSEKGRVKSEERIKNSEKQNRS